MSTTHTAPSSTNQPVPVKDVRITHIGGPPIDAVLLTHDHHDDNLRRHGPPFSRPVAGEVIGFAVEA